MYLLELLCHMVIGYYSLLFHLVDQFQAWPRQLRIPIETTKVVLLWILPQSQVSPICMILAQEEYVESLSRPN